MLHWTEEHKKKAGEAKDFHDLIAVTLDALRSHPKEKPLGIVLGPVSTGGLGSREKNSRALALAVEALREREHNIFNIVSLQQYLDPLIASSHKPEKGAYQMDILDIFFYGIYNSKLIQEAYFLPLWETSTGARWEREHMPQFGIQIREYPEELWEKCLTQL